MIFNGQNRRNFGLCLCLSLFMILPSCNQNTHEHPSQNEGVSPITEDSAFKILQQARDAKQAGDFEKAKTILDEYLGYQETAGGVDNPTHREIKDERQIHLLISKARAELAKLQQEEMGVTLTELAENIVDHPDRLRYSRELDELRSNQNYLDMAMSANIKSQVRVIEIHLNSDFEENGRYPETEEGFQNVLRWASLADRVVLLSYQSHDDGQRYEARLKDKQSGREYTMPVRAEE